jgi:CP family cyanate transporter-like MFS transporter
MEISIRPGVAARLVIIAGVSAALHVGKLPPALVLLRETFGMSLLEAGFLLSNVQFAGMALGLLAGTLADSWGLRRTMVAGLLLMGAASFAGGLAEGAGLMLVARLVEGVGLLFVATPAPALLRALVPPVRLASTLGLWGTYMPTGFALALMLGPYQVQWLGWRSWWNVLGAISFMMAIVISRIAPVKPPDVGLRQSVPGVRPPAQGEFTRWRRRAMSTLGSSGCWLIALSFAMYSAQWLAVVGFLPSIYAERGLAGPLAGALTAVVALANMVGNLAAGQLLQRGRPAWFLLGAGFLAMGILSIAGFANSGAGASARYFAVLLFSGFGGLIPGTLFSLAVRMAPSEDTISTSAGWMQQLSALGQFSGPPLAATIAGISSGWQNTWILCTSCCGVGLLLAHLIRAHPRSA